MKTYLIQLDNGTSGLRWEYRFTSSSNEMAKEYVKRMSLYDDAAKTSSGVVLFGPIEDNDGPFICRFANRHVVEQV